MCLFFLACHNTNTTNPSLTATILNNSYLQGASIAQELVNSLLDNNNKNNNNTNKPQNKSSIDTSHKITTTVSSMYNNLPTLVQTDDKNNSTSLFSSVANTNLDNTNNVKTQQQNNMNALVQTLSNNNKLNINSSTTIPTLIYTGTAANNNNSNNLNHTSILNSLNSNSNATGNNKMYTDLPTLSSLPTSMSNQYNLNTKSQTSITQTISKSNPLMKGVRDCSKNYELDIIEDEEHGRIYEIACGGHIGQLYQKKFVCPGINSKCIKMGHDEWLTPKEFVAKGGKESLKDWKRAIKIQKTNLRKLIESGGLDYYQHKKCCSNQCRSNKSDYLNPLNSLNSNHAKSFDAAYLNRGYQWDTTGLLNSSMHARKSSGKGSFKNLVYKFYKNKV